MVIQVGLYENPFELAGRLVEDYGFAGVVPRG